LEPDVLIRKRPIGTIAYLGGVPAVLEAFAWSWGQLLLHSQEAICLEDEYIHTDRATFSYHPVARNSLVDRMYGEWLLMLDADHSFDPDLLVRMLNRMTTNNLDVLTGFYQFKKPPYAPVLFVRNADEKPVSVICDWSPEADIIEVSSAGAGCLLVKRKVFDRIAVELKEKPFDCVHGLSEDHSFFWRIKQLGIKAWCDLRIECNHLRIHPVAKKEFDNSEMEQSEPIPVAGWKD
jgi:hypothetical protein